MSRSIFRTILKQNCAMNTMVATIWFHLAPKCPEELRSRAQERSRAKNLIRSSPEGLRSTPQELAGAAAPSRNGPEERSRAKNLTFGARSRGSLVRFSRCYFSCMELLAANATGSSPSQSEPRLPRNKFRPSVSLFLSLYTNSSST